MGTLMGKKHTLLMQRQAFDKMFVEMEIMMRKALSDLIEKEIKTETNPATIVGLRKAQEIVFGKVERSES